MENVRRYRALASLCRQQAAYRPLQNWQLLGQAEHFEYLAEIALKAHFDACNAQREDDAIAATAWERPAAAWGSISNSSRDNLLRLRRLVREQRLRLPAAVTLPRFNRVDGTP